MALRSIVEKSLIKAFDALDDLSIDATLQNLKESSFDFGSREVFASGESEVAVRFVVVSSKKNKSSTTVRKILLRTAEVIDVSSYGKLLVDGSLWSIGPIIHDGEYVTLLGISNG